MRINMLKFPDKKYSIIYCDPPWKYENWNEAWHQTHPQSRWAGKKYSLMPIEDLMALPVEALAEKNAVIFMWTIGTMLPDALKLMASWGFKYRTIAFVWVKKNIKKDTIFTGMGYWTRSNAEICLLGIKGKPLPRISHSISQVVITPRGRHSQKPAEVRDRIVALLGDLPRIELFAREATVGWDIWGDEAPE